MQRAFIVEIEIMKYQETILVEVFRLVFEL